MALLTLLKLLLIASISATCHGSEYQIHQLRPKSGAAGTKVPGVNCLSWRLAVEANNIIGWTTIPKECTGSTGYIGHYMLGQQYREDSKAVIAQASLHAQSLKLAGDGKDIWVFDIDETTLSNLPYYVHHGLGVESYNATSFNQWVLEGKAPALPESLRLYKELRKLGTKIVFLTGRTEDKRNATVTNLKKVGFYKWEKLILKSSSFSGKTAVFYKSSERAKLEKLGYRIVGNIGDQWSDLLGTNEGKRTFKLPDPMYYIA